jgi:large subunit ribosomal protein L21
MYAIVKIGNHQFRVVKGQSITVNRLEGNEGENVELGEVLLYSNEGKVEVGTPTTGKKIQAKILEHLKGDKVIVFKKKRRKGYKVKNGHRQALTKISVEAIA